MLNSGISLNLFNENVLFPKRSTFFSAGYDIFSPIDFKINPYSSYELELPIHFSSQNSDLQEYDILFVVRSSYGIKKNLRIIDKKGNFIPHASYDFDQKSIKIILFNDTHEVLSIPKNEHFLQFVITKRADKFTPVSFEEVSKKTANAFPYEKFSIQEGNHVYSLETHNKIVLLPNQRLSFPIGFKAKFEKGEWLGASVSSFYNKEIIFANLTPVIDADYFENSTNEGLIFIGLVNTTKGSVTIERNTIVCDFWAKPFYLLSNEISPEQSRNGGIGSTTEKNNK